MLVLGIGAAACQAPGPGTDPTSTTSTSSTSTSTTVQPAPGTKRIDLEVLVVSSGDVGTASVRDLLLQEGVPWEELDLLDPERPRIDASYLADTVDGLRRSRFQAVVLPDAAPVALDDAELRALDAVQEEFGIRRLATYTYPSGTVGLETPEYSGSLDGATGQLTGAALAGSWGYLRGPVAFDDVDPEVSETYGYLARPAEPSAHSSFEPLLELTEGGVSGTVMGVHREHGREQLVVTASLNSFQRQLLVLGTGIVDWLTRGVHLGARQNHLTVHADDVLVPNDRWSIEHDCTPEVDCAGDVALPTIRMDATDAAALAAWQLDRGFLIDLVANGEGALLDRAPDGSTTGLTAELLERRSSFRWINHTWSHEYLGCVQDRSATSWECATDEDGVVWNGPELISDQIERNLDWAAGVDVAMDRRELVTGEHSGLRRAPEEPSDNPHLAPELRAAGVEVVASDASRELRQRRLGDGSVVTLPRYPFNLFYNTATIEEQVDEYNWIYTTTEDGGSGICEVDERSTCIEPLDPTTGFDDHIRPLEAHLSSLRVLNGLPLPHYAHQSDLTEDRLLLDVLDDVLGWYRGVFASNTPLVNPGMRQAASSLERIQAWRDSLVAGEPAATAHLVGDRLVIESAQDRVVPLTVPSGATRDGQPAGTPYGTGLRSWAELPAGGALTVDLLGS